MKIPFKAKKTFSTKETKLSMNEQRNDPQGCLNVDSHVIWPFPFPAWVYLLNSHASEEIVSKVLKVL